MDNSRQYVVESLSAKESWRLFRIMAETVEAIETLGGLPKCVSIFGSSRSTPSDPIYRQTEEVTFHLAKAGFGVITGGGPGHMEAGNKGAQAGGGPSVGLHIHLPMEQEPNKFLDVRCDFRYFFIRKLMFVKYAHAFVVMPGGMGTVDELSEAFVLMQTNRIKPFPIILYDSTFWTGLLDWLRGTMVERGYIRRDEIDLLAVCDTPAQVLATVNNNVR